MQAFLDVQNAFGRTALHEAAEIGNLIIVKQLVSLGASIRILDNNGKTAFDLGKNHIEVASYLGQRMIVKFQEEAKYDDALKIYNELLQVQEGVLGCDHSKTIITRQNIRELKSLMYLFQLSDTKPPSFMEDMESQNRYGRTPLHVAAENGNLNFVKLLVSIGVNMNILDNDGKTAFELGKNHIEVASFLGYIMGEKFQEEKKYEDAVKVYEELLLIQEEMLGSEHSDTKKTRAIIGSLHSLLYLLGISDTKPPSFMKDLETQNNEGRTALHAAAETGQMFIVKRLVSAGVNISILDNDGKTAFDLGKNHIEVASFLGHRMGEKFQEEVKYEDAVNVYEELLQIQEEVLGNDHSCTTETRDILRELHSLMYLLGLSDIKPPSFMKDMESQNDDGRTPLHGAAQNGNVLFVKRLVSVGVNINILDNDGKTAFDLAKNHIEVASFLGHRMIEKFLEEEKYEDVLKIYKDLFEIQKENLGYDHPETIETDNNVKYMQIIISELGASEKEQMLCSLLTK